MPDHFFYFVRLSKDGKANLQRVKNTGVVEEFLHLNVFRGTSEGIFISAISSYTLQPTPNLSGITEEWIVQSRHSLQFIL